MGETKLPTIILDILFFIPKSSKIEMYLDTKTKPVFMAFG